MFEMSFEPYVFKCFSRDAGIPIPHDCPSIDQMFLGDVYIESENFWL